MKKLFLTAVLVLLPLTVCAQMPFGESFQALADKLGIQREEQEQLVQFAEGLKGDTVIDCSITSLYPPAIDITFASGREIHAHGTELQLRDNYDDDPYNNYRGLCLAVFFLGYLLTWAGFFTLSLQLLLTGFEIVFFTLALCL
ncbi:MAG: hypothetical protein WCQ99_15030 [Pseudomonadota bacterium]